MEGGKRSDTPDLVSTGEVARILGSSRQHVVDLCTRGDLPFVWVGRHRRVRRSDVDRLLEVEDQPLTRDQERSLWLHRALVGRLVEEPEQVLDHARRNATRFLAEQRQTGMTAHWLSEWLRVLDSGVDEVAEILTSRDAQAVELRQNSPFAGILGHDTRSRVLTAFVRHWRADHGDAYDRRDRVRVDG